MDSITKLKRAPLVHAIAQVRFEPVTYIEKSIPELQEPLKKLGFPRLKKNAVQQIVLEGIQPRMESMTRWDFVDREQRTAINLTSEFVSVQTSRYEVFDTFARLLREVFRIVQEHTDVEVVQRIGIRYVDLIRPDSGRVFSDYIQPGLVGFPFGALGTVQFTQHLSNTQSVGLTTDGGTLVVKCLQNAEGQFLPPDLNPTGLSYDVKINEGEVVAILDFDHFQVIDMDFVPELLIKRFDALHAVAKDAFLKAITSEAVNIWNQ